MRRNLVLILMVFIGLVFFMPSDSSAQSTEEIQSFSAQIKVNTDSTINVTEEIKYFFPSKKHGIYRYIPYRYLDKEQNKYFQTPISEIQITDENNQPYKYSTSHQNDELKLKIGDPDKTISGQHTYKISYKVAGVLNYFSDHDELYWNITGDLWPVEINNVSAIITLPSNIDSEKIQTACYTGSTGSTASDCSQNTINNTALFQSAQGPLTIVVGWPKGVVTPLERTYEISFRHESAWFLLVPLLVFIWMLIKYFRKGRDPFGRGTIAPEFAPPENLRPAEMGTLIRERIHNQDITATIIDFAVRGLLKIKEENKKLFLKTQKEYTLIKLKEPDSTFRNYEKDFFEKIFAGGKEVKVSDLYKNLTNLAEIKNTIYQNLVDQKYFTDNPNKIRLKYLLIGIGLMSIPVVFFWLSWILVFGLILSGIIVCIFSFFMPKKTKEGVILKEKSLGFKEFLFRAERYRLKWQEKEKIFEKYLPYALVFGIAEIWAKNFKDIYKNPPSWYEGDFATFNTVVFASSLNSFSTTASHSFSPPASSGSSGFSGGGFSGGGFGGGGGGSW